VNISERPPEVEDRAVSDLLCKGPVHLRGR
jgi:hypothetical protein